MSETQRSQPRRLRELSRQQPAPLKRVRRGTRPLYLLLGGVLLVVVGVLGYGLVEHSLVRHPVDATIERTDLYVKAGEHIQVNVVNACGADGMAMKFTEFLRARKFGQIGEGLVDGWIERSELRHQLMADAVAGVGCVGVSGVSPPGLIARIEEGFDLSASGRKQRADDLSASAGRRLDIYDGVNGGESCGPCAANQLHQDGFGLVVEGVGGQDGVHVAGGDEAAEEGVAGLAGGLFHGLAVLGGTGWDIGVMDVQGDVVLEAEILDEGEIGVRFGGLPDSVMDVRRGEADPKGVAGCRVGLMDGKEEGH